MYSEKRKFGNVGELAAANHLKRKGFRILETNYLKKWGEIDIVAEKVGTVHFFEVKTVSRENFGQHVSQETWRPEDNVHPGKLKKLYRTIETWIAERKYDGDWQVDVAAVELDPKTKKGRIRIVENV